MSRMLTRTRRILNHWPVLGSFLQRRSVYSSVCFSTPSPTLSSGAISRTMADIDTDGAVAYSNPTESPGAISVILPGSLQPRVVVYDGVCHLCHGAALRVVSYLPLPYSALNTFSIVPTPLRDSVYDYVAKNRYNWFGKAEDCLVLKDKELLEQFVDRDEVIDRS